MIFEEPTGRRWRLTVLSFWCAFVLIGFLTFLLLLGTLLQPDLGARIAHERQAIHAHSALLSEYVDYTETTKQLFSIDHTSAQSSETQVRQPQNATPIVRWKGEQGEVFHVRQTDEEAFELERVGGTFPANSVILTFDDGPDPDWTPQLLDVLKQEKVQAVFFVTGSQAAKHPELIRELEEQGHLIGNHTFSHPNLFQTSPLRIESELNLAQRILQSILGHGTTLFRTPFYIRTDPNGSDELHTLATTTAAGYSYVGASIDSDDWMGISSQEIIGRVEERLGGQDQHIILFHDGGGNRSATIEAVSYLIPALKEQGFTFTSLDEAMGIERSTMQPVLSGLDAPLATGVAFSTSALHTLFAVFKFLFFVTAVLAGLRVAFIGSLVVLSLFRSKQTADRQDQTALVTVLIPAFNESATIEKTIRAVQQSSYRNLEILVIDDGSSDATARIVEQLSQQDPRLTVIWQQNGGKFSALNRGFAHAQGSLVVTIDADTIVLKETIAQLVAPFVDPAVSASCGNIEVGNVRGLLTGFQSLEYITVQNFDRCAFDVLNCISCVPGATSAWRKSAVLAAGGYTNDTLTEDADLTMAINTMGGTIVHVQQARSLTEAPSTLRDLVKQRFRWVFGTFQCLRKHSGQLGKRTFGWIALPNVFLFNFLFPLLSPIGDLAFAVAVLQNKVSDIFLWYLFFVYMDLIGSLLAFIIEQKPKKLMWLILIQRFFYRQFIYCIVYMALTAALRGYRYGWNKVRRSGDVPGQHITSYFPAT